MRLFLYILREYFKYVMGTIVLVLFLFVLFDFIHRTTKYFNDYHPKTIHLFQFYLYQMPTQLLQAMPIAALLASVIAMALLARGNEVTAMRAAGMSPIAIGFPLAFGGMALAVTSFLISEFIQPKTAAKQRYVKDVIIEGEADVMIAEGARWVRDKNNLVSFMDFNPRESTLNEMQMIEMGPNFRPVRIVQIDSGKYNAETNTWDLHGKREFEFLPNGVLSKTKPIPDNTQVLPMQPKKLKRERRQPDELSINELRDLITRGEEQGADTIAYQVDFQMKFAYPFAALAVSLLGLRFGYRSERTSETVKGILLAFGIGMSYWFILNAARALGRRGDVNPVFAAWLANIVLFTYVGIDLSKLKKI